MLLRYYFENSLDYIVHKHLQLKKDLYNHHHTEKEILMIHELPKQ